MKMKSGYPGSWIVKGKGGKGLYWSGAHYLDLVATCGWAVITEIGQGILNIFHRNYNVMELFTPLISRQAFRQLDGKLPGHLPESPHSGMIKRYSQLQLSNPPNKRGTMSSLKLALVIVTVVSLDMGLSNMTKAAMSRGMSQFVFVVYSNLFGLPCLVLFCFLFHRRKPPPPLTPSILWRIFVLGLISCSTQMFIYVGIRYSSPTLVSAMTDLVPAFTFILAIITRMENLDLRVSSSCAKSIGTIVSITGALTMTMYEGPPIIAFTSSTSTKLNGKGNDLSPQASWVVGGFLSAIAAFMLAILYVFQASIIRTYPAEPVVTLICCAFVVMLSSIVSLIAERNPSAWKLKPDMELIAIVYAAILVVSVRNVTSIWVIRQKGPFFVAMFEPVGIVVAVVMGVTFLGDTLYLGSVVGAVIIAIGFYTVMWGKAKEEKILQDNQPLLQNITP